MNTKEMAVVAVPFHIDPTNSASNAILSHVFLTSPKLMFNERHILVHIEPIGIVFISTYFDLKVSRLFGFVEGDKSNTEDHTQGVKSLKVFFGSIFRYYYVGLMTKEFIGTCLTKRGNQSCGIYFYLGRHDLCWKFNEIALMGRVQLF